MDGRDSMTREGCAYTCPKWKRRAFAVPSLLAELTGLSCQGNAVNSGYFKEPGEKRSPRGSVLEKSQYELAGSATRVTDNSKQLLKWSGLKGLCMGKLSSLGYFYVWFEGGECWCEFLKDLHGLGRRGLI